MPWPTCVNASLSTSPWPMKEVVQHLHLRYENACTVCICDAPTEPLLVVSFDRGVKVRVREKACSFLSRWAVWGCSEVLPWS